MDYRTHPLDEFLDSIASETVAPAGGTATAVVGATGASLCEMVCVHTLGNEADADVAEEMAALRDDLRKQREHLLDLAGADATVVDELFSRADGDGEVEQFAVKRSIGVPLTVAVACGNVLELAVDVAATGTRNALPDAGTGVILTRAALRAAVFTARSNVDRVEDQSFVDEIEARTTELETRADDAHERVLHHVEKRA